jgi:hypothetical protein
MVVGPGAYATRRGIRLTIEVVGDRRITVNFEGGNPHPIWRSVVVEVVAATRLAGAGVRNKPHSDSF